MAGHNRPSAEDNRKLTGTGSYNLEDRMERILEDRMERMGLGNDSDNYSDDDFYSDEETRT